MSEARRTVARATIVAMAAAALLAAGGEAQELRTMTSARQLEGTDPVQVHVDYAAGTLDLRPARRPMLYRMELRYDEGRVRPVTRYDERTRTLRLGTDGREGRHGPRRPRGREGQHATIELSRDVPLELELDFGAGQAEIDLGGLRLQSLELSTGASETELRFDEPNPIRATRVEINAGAAELRVLGLGNVRADRIDFQGGVGSTLLDFSGAWGTSSAASVKMGIGSVVLRLPRRLGVRIDRNSFLTSFEAEGMTRREGSYFSSNWSSARQRLTIQLEAAIGSIEVHWID